MGGKVVGQRARLRVGQHAPDLPFEFRRLVQPLLRGHSQQFVVGDAAPEEKGESRGKIEIVDAIGLAGRDRARLLLESKQEARIHQDVRERMLHARLESACFLPGLVEAHDEFEFICICLQRPAKCVCREVGNDLARTRSLLIGRCRPADENLLAARCVAEARRVEGAVDHDAEDGALARIDRIEVVHTRSVHGIYQCCGNRTKTRRHADACGAALLQLDGPAVDGDVDLRHGPGPAPEKSGGAGAGLDRNLVFGIERKEVLDAHTAAGAERQTLALGFMIQSKRRAVNDALGLHRQIPKRQTADLHRGIQVALNESRRGAQHVRDVVESLAGCIRRQQRSDVNLQPEQVTDYVGVLRAIEPTHGHRGRSCIGGVEPQRELANEILTLGVLRTRIAGRWHETGVEFANHLFPHIGVRAHVLEIELIESEIRGTLLGVVAGHAVLADEWMRRTLRDRQPGARFIDLHGKDDRECRQKGRGEPQHDEARPPLPDRLASHVGRS